MKFLGSNPETTSKLTDLAGTLTDKAAKIFTSSPTIPITPSGITTKIITPMSTNTSLNAVKIIITLILIGWAIFMIVSRFTIKDPETKDNYNYINTILFGSLGIIPMILCVWLIILLLITILPQISHTLNTSTGFMTTLNNTIGKIFS